jgi:hypothetical protein
MDGASKKLSRHRKRHAYAEKTAIFLEIGRASMSVAL